MGNQDHILLYESSLRVHDEAVDKWLSNLKVDYRIGPNGEITVYQQPILRVFASPQRSFAQVLDLAVSRGLVTRQFADAQKTAGKQDLTVLPHPVCFVQRGEPTPDPELSGVPKVFRKRWYNEALNQWEMHRWPQHMRTDYTVTVRCTKRYSEAFIREWFYSQLGPVGAGHAELFIPVDHGQVWGVHDQSLKFVSSSDETEYEGAEPRYLRFSFVFALRTWIMFKPALVPPVYFVGTDSVDGGRTYGSNNLSAAVMDTGLLLETPNLYFCPLFEQELSTRWPKTGTATVARSPLKPNAANIRDLTQLGLRIGLNTTGDSVTLVEDETVIDGDGYGIVKVTMSHVGDAAVLQMNHRALGDSNTYAPAYSVNLPAVTQWTRLCRFVLFRDAVFDARVAYSGGAVATLDVDRIDVRVLAAPPIKVLTSRTDNGDGRWLYTWNTAAGQYLAVVAFTAGTGTVTLNGGGGRSEPADAAVNAGIVLVCSPDGAGSIAILVSKSLTLAAVYIQPYGGGFPGDGTDTV